MSELDGYRPGADLIGDSPVMHRVIDQLQKAALTEVPVLISGESGSGKELAARLLHQFSPRRTRKFLKVNCPAIPPQDFDREFFGYKYGSYLDAATGRAGRWGRANKGTLFLDEVGELDLRLQPKLLHVLQDIQEGRFGAATEPPPDVRLVCATSRDLESQAASGKFRGDLLYRINVLRIRIPSLRERISDVPILMEHFIQVYGRLSNEATSAPSVGFMKLLRSYHWPGNIRELENFAKQYVVLGGEEHVLSVLRDPDASGLFSPDVAGLTTPLRIQTKRALEEIEKKIITRVLEAHEWNRRKAADSLDISYRALLLKIKRSGLPTARYNKPITTPLHSSGIGEMLRIHALR